MALTCSAVGLADKLEVVSDSPEPNLSDKDVLIAMKGPLSDARAPESMARDAMQQRLLVNNPQDVAYEDALSIYRAAY